MSRQCRLDTYVDAISTEPADHDLYRIALLPAGSRVCEGLLASLRWATHHHFRLLGIDSAVQVDDFQWPWSLHFDTVFTGAPTWNDPLDDWVAYLHHLSVTPTHIVPTNDEAAWLLAKLRRHGYNQAHCMVPSYALTRVMLSKRETYALLGASLCPRAFRSFEVEHWYAKPDRGHGGVGCRPLASAEEAEWLHDNDKNTVVCERLEGRELTVELWGSQVMCVRERLCVVQGQSQAARLVELNDEEHATVLGTLDKLHSLGLPLPPQPWFLQLKGGRVLELQPRLPGGHGASCLVLGASALWHWVQTVRRRVSGPPPYPQHLTPRLSLPVTDLQTCTHWQAVHWRADQPLSAVWLDLDDTLLGGGGSTVNSRLLAAVWKLVVTQRLPVGLLTYHTGDVRRLLTLKWHLCLSFFTLGVHQLPKPTEASVARCKAQFVGTYLARRRGGLSDLSHHLLIDDSHTERTLWQRAGGWACVPGQAAGLLAAVNVRVDYDWLAESGTPDAADTPSATTNPALSPDAPRPFAESKTTVTCAAKVPACTLPLSGLVVAEPSTQDRRELALLRRHVSEEIRRFCERASSECTASRKARSVAEPTAWLEVGPPTDGALCRPFLAQHRVGHAACCTHELSVLHYSPDEIKVVPHSEGGADLYGDLTTFVPAAQGAYDYIVCTEVLEHTDNAGAAMDMLVQLLKPGGQALITVPFAFRLHHPTPDMRRLTPQGLVALATSYGCEVQSCTVPHGAPTLSPLDTALVIRKPSGPWHASGEHLRPERSWSLWKGSAWYPHYRWLATLSATPNHFANGGPLVRRLEQTFLSRWPVHNGCEAVAVANGTIGLHALVHCLSAMTGACRWAVQSYTFWCNRQGPLQNATVLPSRDDGCCGPELKGVDPSQLDGLVVTTCFGLMSLPLQQQYVQWGKKHRVLIVFDHAATAHPASHLTGDGCMFSMHETKPLGRGEGGVVVTPDKCLAENVRAYINFGRFTDAKHSRSAVQNGTNGKMSEFAAAPLLAWWDLWEKGVKHAFHQRADSLYRRVLSSDSGLQPLFNYHAEDWLRVASLAVKLTRPCTPEWLVYVKQETTLPVNHYYQPLVSESEDHAAWQLFRRSCVVPIHPFVDQRHYDRLMVLLEHACRL